MKLRGGSHIELLSNDSLLSRKFDCPNISSYRAYFTRATVDLSKITIIYCNVDKKNISRRNPTYER